MSAYAPAPNAYRESAVLTATPEQLVVMLYDGARRFLHRDARVRIHRAASQALAVGFEPQHAVGGVSHEVARHEDARGILGIAVPDAARLQDANGEARELRFGHSGLMSAARTTLPHFSVSVSM
jgi:hypothetical protein